MADLYDGRSDPRVALATAVASMGVAAAMYVSGQRGAELSTAPIPDFLRCDGEFVAEKRGGDEKWRSRRRRRREGWRKKWGVERGDRKKLGGCAAEGRAKAHTPLRVFLVYSLITYKQYSLG